MTRWLAAALVVLSAVAVTATPSFASQASTDTEHFTNMVESDVVPDCNGNGPYTETFVSSGVMHTTQLAGGLGFHFTVTAVGTDTLVPSDPSLPTFTGHFTFWEGDNISQKTDIETFTQSEILRGTDGSTLRFTIVLQTAAAPNGHVVSFAHSNCVQR
jgi:hypothetical protein